MGVHKISKDFKILETYGGPKEESSVVQDAVYNMYCDDKYDTVWIGTANSGVFKLNTKTKEVKQYKNDPNDPPCSIDYIVLKGDWQCETVYKWTDEENGIYLSDHYPVCAVIKP